MTIPKSKTNKSVDLSLSSKKSNEMSYPNYDPVGLNRLTKRPMSAKITNKI
jgi:hypothetical protein